MTVHLVAITGGSGSGKTWLARRLRRRLGCNAGLVSLDDFYRDLSALSKRERDRRNFDNPAAIEWSLFLETLARIKRGAPAVIPRYDFASHTRRPQPRLWMPKPIVLLEGLWLLREPRARRLYSLSVYLNIPGEVRLQRRVARDRKERSRSRASVLRQFRAHVQPMHERFVAPQVRHADIVLDLPIGDVTLGKLVAMVKELNAKNRMVS
ncbi:MAG: uridine kinase [Verrucomicrobia bacterium]|nr:uridine kinase [Verrucomicrobiota bacterium]